MGSFCILCINTYVPGENTCNPRVRVHPRVHFICSRITTHTRVVTRICMAGKGYRMGTGAVWPVESRGFTRALAYLRSIVDAD